MRSMSFDDDQPINNDDQHSPEKKRTKRGHSSKKEIYWSTVDYWTTIAYWAAVAYSIVEHSKPFPLKKEEGNHKENQKRKRNPIRTICYMCILYLVCTICYMYIYIYIYMYCRFFSVTVVVLVRFAENLFVLLRYNSRRNKREI